MIIMQEDVDFLEHFGVKGQKWGVRKLQDRTARKTAKVQKNIDLVEKVAKGTATKKEALVIGNRTGAISKKSAKEILNSSSAQRQKVINGESKVLAMLYKTKGIDANALKYPSKFDTSIPKPKTEKEARARKVKEIGSKAVVGLIVTGYVASSVVLLAKGFGVSKQDLKDTGVAGAEAAGRANNSFKNRPTSYERKIERTDSKLDTRKSE